MHKLYTSVFISKKIRTLISSSENVIFCFRLHTQIIRLGYESGHSKLTFWVKVGKVDKI